MVRVARAMAMVMKRVMGTDGNMMAMAVKRVMASNGNITGNGYGREAGGHAMAATMAMGMGTMQKTWPLTLRLERGV
jgi:hypothetical protein